MHRELVDFKVTVSIIFFIFFLCLQIREDTDTRIDLPTETSSSDVIVITGRKENVQKAKARILEIEKEMVKLIAILITSNNLLL